MGADPALVAHWRRATDPQFAVDRQAARFETSLDRLPPATGRVFMMREFLGFESDEFERPLRLGERAALQLHLVMCSGCTNDRQQLQTLRQVAHRYADGGAPQGGLDDETS